MRKRKRAFNSDHEDHVDESWLIPYADLLTLLLALFIVLYAASTVDKEKYQSIMESFQSELTGTKIESQQAGLSPNPSSPQPEIGLPEEEVKSETNDKELDVLRQQLESYIQNNSLEDMVSLEETEKGIEVSLKDVVLFDSGRADLKERSYQTLNGLVGLINTVPNPISIEGHTDNVPAHNTIYKTNWELSAARAASVLHYFESQNVQANRMQFSGFGEYQPLFPNDSDENRQSNRRVTVVILRGR
ncbi:flagellar motor protein MotB [Neobacillus niacini]|uniref:flagellar motor protein MotB n=1 Tax=Neobacillus niacini TaxID=86668 RepID=UPI0007ABC7BC|nr:flagellar motor protein MotB [Neobacillus niacini]MEC1522150.1 flagellar motor protein MotB [Neobacillus niacini]